MNKNKFSIFRIFLIVLGALAVVSFFAMPMATLNKSKLVDQYNERERTDIEDPTFGAFHYDTGESWEDLSDAEHEIVITDAVVSALASNGEALEHDEAEKLVKRWYDIKLPGFYSGLQTVLFSLKLQGIRSLEDVIGFRLRDVLETISPGGGQLSLDIPPIVLIILLVLPVILGVLTAVLAAVGRKPGYIGSIVTGAVMTGLMLFTSIKIFSLSGDLKDYVVDEDAILRACGSFNKLYILLLIIPVAILVFAILGLVLDRQSAPEGMGDWIERPADFYAPDYGPDAYGQDPYGPDAYGPGSYGQGALVGIKGDYLGATIPVADGEQVVIGRNPSASQVVIDNAAVSRVHCYVTYMAAQNTYGVTDVSKFGVYDGTGNRLSSGQMTYLQPGDEIHIGRSHNVFRLQ